VEFYPAARGVSTLEIEWTDTDPTSGERRFVRAEKFARLWQFKVRFKRRTNWQRAEPVTRDMWETLLDALERRYPRREGVTDDDLAAVRRIIADMDRKAARQAEADAGDAPRTPLPSED
jgi:hypothetical protein